MKKQRFNVIIGFLLKCRQENKVLENEISVKFCCLLEYMFHASIGVLKTRKKLIEKILNQIKRHL